MMENGRSRKRRQLSPEEKWEVSLEVTSLEMMGPDSATFGRMAGFSGMRGRTWAVVSAFAAGLSLYGAGPAAGSMLVSAHGPLIGPRFAGGQVVWGERLPGRRVVVKSSAAPGSHAQVLFEHASRPGWATSIGLAGGQGGPLLSLYTSLVPPPGPSCERLCGVAPPPGTTAQFLGAFLLGPGGDGQLAAPGLQHDVENVCLARECEAADLVAADGGRVAYPAGGPGRTAVRDLAVPGGREVVVEGTGTRLALAGRHLAWREPAPQSTTTEPLDRIVVWDLERRKTAYAVTAPGRVESLALARLARSPRRHRVGRCPLTLERAPRARRGRVSLRFRTDGLLTGSPTYDPRPHSITVRTARGYRHRGRRIPVGTTVASYSEEASRRARKTTRFSKDGRTVSLQLNPVGRRLAATNRRLRVKIVADLTGDLDGLVLKGPGARRTTTALRRL